MTVCCVECSQKMEQDPRSNRTWKIFKCDCGRRVLVTRRRKPNRKKPRHGEKA